MAERLLKRLLQGYIWHPRELEMSLDDYLPTRLESDIHLIWDEMPRAPFAFFEDGTLSATQTFYQFTVVKPVDDTDTDLSGSVPWLVETLQAKLESTPEGVGWHIFEDLRDVDY